MRISKVNTMAIIPKNFKFKKYFKGKIRTTVKNEKVIFGDISLKAAEPARITPKQMDSARRAIKKIIKPVNGIVRIRIRAYLPVTSKPLAVRQGRGKGKVALNISQVKKGMILFEIYCGTDFKIALEAARQGALKLPMKVLIIKKL